MYDANNCGIPGTCRKRKPKVDVNSEIYLALAASEVVQVGMHKEHIESKGQNRNLFSPFLLEIWAYSLIGIIFFTTTKYAAR